VVKVLVGAPFSRASDRARTHSGHTRTQKQRSGPVGTGQPRPLSVAGGRRY
jgi:hypothetical protein